MIRSLLIALLFAAPAFGQQPVPPAAPPVADAPALAGRGALPVGVRTQTMRFAGRADATRPDGNGGFAQADRVLPVTVWYPAAGGEQRITYSYPTTKVASVPAGAVPDTVTFPGRAARDAAPADGRWPLLIVSHGLFNRAAMFSELAEIIASRGYVVAVIDHGDLEDPAPRPVVFLNVVVHRADDQRLVIAEIARRARAADPLWRHADAGNVALAGYSMGGFGALAAAGAGYDPRSPLFAQAPPGTAALLAPQPVPAGLKALIAFAPWGGGPPLRAFDVASLRAVKVPSLFIDGDQDDVADYARGVRWLWDGVGGETWLLTYQGARHNVATNGTPAVLADRFEYRERQDEPVWRKDRMLGINAHMVTAFLDWQLKGAAERRAYLAVPTPRAADGAWPLAPGEDAGDRTAVPGSTFWPGFQRRWAVGLVMEHRAAAEAATPR